MKEGKNAKDGTSEESANSENAKKGKLTKNIESMYAFLDSFEREREL